MVECIVSSSVLIIVVIIIRYAFNEKISRRLQYALWGLVLIRLLLPFSLFESSLSIMNAFPKSLMGSKQSINQIHNLNKINNYNKIDLSNSLDNSISSNIQQSKYIPNTISTDQTLGVVWLVGSLIVSLWFIFANLIFYIRIYKSRKAYDIPFKLKVYVSDKITSPCLFGIFRPSIYLTPKSSENQDNLKHILAHELCHYSHKDHIWSILRGVCLAIWWWNPLVWVSAFLSQKDCELACDEAVIKKIGDHNRLAYGRTLIDMITLKKPSYIYIFTATTMNFSNNSIKQRLKTIIKKPKTFIPALIAVVIIIVISIISTFTGAKSANSNENIVKQYAWNYISNDIKNYESTGIKIIDSKIVNLKQIARYDKIINYPIELWLLEYRLLPNDINKVIFAGGMQQEDGWITEYSSMAQPCLIVSYANGKPTYMGNTWTANFSEEGGRETALRIWLESNGYLTKETYPGNHATVSFYLSDKTRAQLLLSQPVRQGDTGIWCVERWSDEHGNEYLVTPDKNGLALDYYIKLQQECDNGHRPGLLNAKQVALEYITSVLGQSATLDSIKISYNTDDIEFNNLEKYISQAILKKNADKNKQSDFATEAHTVLKKEENDKIVTVYAMALYSEFEYKDGGFYETGGSHMPIAITFEKTNSGVYNLMEYWTPQDGSGYAPSIKNKFPSEIYDDAIDTQKYILSHIQSTYIQAIKFGNIDTDVIIERLIDTICSSPSQASNPKAYIDAHPIEFRELSYLGDYTLKYVYSKFLKGNQTDLKSHIMLAAMRKLLDDEDLQIQTDTTQQWFNQFKESADKLSKKSSVDYIRKNKPKTYLLIQMLNDIKGQ